MNPEPSKTLAEIEAEAPDFARVLKRARDRAKGLKVEQAQSSTKPTDLEVTARLTEILERAERAGAR